MTRFEVKGLCAGYTSKLYLHDVSFSIEAGQILCVLGPNGCGKTTLFRAMLNFLPPSAGSVLVDGEDLRAKNAAQTARLVSYIPQIHTPVFGYRAIDMVIMGRACFRGAFSSPGREDEKAAMRSLERLNVGYLAQRRYTQLSGGERRLVLIARSLCQQARIMIMDEPASDLDFSKGRLIYDIVESLAEEGYIVIMSTHSPEYPFGGKGRALLMKTGRQVAFGPPCETLTAEKLEEAYGSPIQVIDIVDSDGRQRKLCLALESRG